MKKLIKKSVLIAMSIMGVCFGSMAQEPDLISKNIAEFPLFDGSTLPVEAGWQLLEADAAVLGKISANKGEVSISCGDGEFYRFLANPATKPQFAPNSDYTIEFRVKVPQNNGRGMDFQVKDGINTHSLLVFGHNRLILNGEKTPILSINNKDFHTYRLAVERTKRKMYIYADGKYITSLDLVKNGATPSLMIGKGNGKATTDIVIDYITFELGGAYKPAK